MLEIVALTALQDNYIWLVHNGQDAVVIDPGEASGVLAYLAAHRLQLQAIYCTHAHADHISGVAALMGVFASAKIVAHPTSPLASMPSFCPISVGEIEFAGNSVQVLAVPGHTQDHLVFYWPVLEALFCGDTLFAGGCGRVFGGTAAQLYIALQTLVLLPATTKVYCAHEYTLGNLVFACQVEPKNPALTARLEMVQGLRAHALSTLPTTLAIELATNPFLRCHIPAIKQAVCQKMVCDSNASVIEVFAGLRAWKNQM